MRRSWWYSVNVALFLLFASMARGQDFVQSGESCTTVSVTSATVGKQLVASVKNYARMGVPSGAAVAICLAPVERAANGTDNCGTGLTNPAVAEPCVQPGEGWEWNPRVDKWAGQVCGILKSGTTAVTVGVCKW